jgi:hypothetical protein
MNKIIKIFYVLDKLAHVGDQHTLIKVGRQVRMPRPVSADTAELKYLFNLYLYIMGPSVTRGFIERTFS